MRRFVTILALLLFAGSSYAREQVYTDSAGGKHRWEINAGHTLIWEGKPWFPAGGMITSLYLTYTGDKEGPEADQAWEKDVAALKTIKEHGIRDLYINPISGTGVPTKKFQRLINYLESEGFRYGIEITDGPKSPPTVGYVVPPTPYRLTGFSGTGTASWKFDPKVKSALFAVVAPTDFKLVKVGSLEANDQGEVSAALSLPAGSYDVYFVPKKTAEAPFQNFWEGAEAAKQYTIKNLSALKLGPGFRFFVDPNINEMAFEPDTNLIPSSDAYRKQFAQWLSGQEHDPGALSRRWHLDSNLSSWAEAGRLVPLCIDKSKKIGYLLDESTGKTFKIDAFASFYWQDALAFRDLSVQQYNRAIADALKQKIANVPVVIKVTTESKIRQFLTNPAKSGGFDGLGIEGYGYGEALASGVAGYGYAEILASGQPMWFIVTETMDDASQNKPDMGYPSKDAMFRDLDAMREIGAKGTFVFGLYLAGYWPKHALVNDPQQLDWLKEYGDKMAADPAAVDYRPKTATYPAPYPELANFTAREWEPLAIYKDADGIWHLPRIAPMDFLPDRKPRGEAVPIPKASKPIKIDASPDEWGGVPAIKLGQKSQLTTGAPSWKGPEDLSSNIQLMWDERNLYLFADVLDDHPLLNTQADAVIYQGDCLELYFGASGPESVASYSAGDSQTGFSTGDGGSRKPVIFNWQRGGVVSGGEIAVARSDKGYRLEASVPFSVLGLTDPQPGKLVGLDFVLDDRDDANLPRADKSLTWHGNNANWRDPSAWGVGKLTE